MATRCSAPASSPPGSGARDTLRLEAGLPLHGHELGPGITPLQAGLGLGRRAGTRATSAAATRSPPRRSAASPGACAGMRVEGRRPPRAGQAVLVGGEVAGSRHERQLLADARAAASRSAFLPPTVEIGDAVEIDVRGDRLPAEVVKTPFVSH